MLPPSLWLYNELSIELKYSMKRIANRVDRGVNIEVRMAEPEAEEGDPPEDGDSGTEAKAYERIQGASEGMQFLRLEGDPILSLPEEPAKGKKAETKAAS